MEFLVKLITIVVFIFSIVLMSGAFITGTKNKMYGLQARFRVDAFMALSLLTVNILMFVVAVIL